MTEMNVTLPEPTSGSRLMPAAMWDVALGGPQVPAWPAVIGGTGSVELPTIDKEQACLTADQAEAFALAVLAAVAFSRRCDLQAQLDATTNALASASSAPAGTDRAGWFRTLADAHTAVAACYEAIVNQPAPGVPDNETTLNGRAAHHHQAARHAAQSAEHEAGRNGA